MKRTLLLLGLAVLIIFSTLMAVSCGTSATTTPGGILTVKPTQPGQTAGPDYTPGLMTAVIIENYAYSPATLTVSAGTTVTWTNRDSVQHTVTSRAPLFDSGLFGKDKSYSYTFTQKGSYEYYCIPHPYMTGKVIVE
jgi:plastocyanin